MDVKEIILRSRKYFEDSLNSVKALTRDTQEVMDFGEEKVFIAAEVATANTGIKSGKGAGENDIRHKMLKALTEESILWLTPVGQVAWKRGKTRF